MDEGRTQEEQRSPAQEWSATWGRAKRTIQSLKSATQYSHDGSKDAYSLLDVPAREGGGEHSLAVEGRGNGDDL